MIQDHAPFLIPQGSLFFSQSPPLCPLVLVAGGRCPHPSWLHRLVAFGIQALWGVDRGARWCRNADLLPDRFVGDGDSLGEHDRVWLQENGVPESVFPVAKDYTDLQLALFEAIAFFPGVPIVVTGIGGGRFDHAFSALYSALWSHRRGGRVIVMGDDQELLMPLLGPAELTAVFRTPPEILSTLALSEECLGVSVQKTLWPLDQVTLRLDEPFAVSSRLVPESSSADFSVQKGWLGVYAAWGMETNAEEGVQKNGLS